MRNDQSTNYLINLKKRNILGHVLHERLKQTLFNNIFKCLSILNVFCKGLLLIFFELIKGVCYQQLITANQLFLNILSISFQTYAKYNKNSVIFY